MNTNQVVDRVGGTARSTVRQAGCLGCVVDAVVELRGEVKRPAIKKALEADARSVPEVRDVKNLLHLRKTPAPGRADSPGKQRVKSK